MRMFAALLGLCLTTNGVLAQDWTLSATCVALSPNRPQLAVIASSNSKGDKVQLRITTPSPILKEGEKTDSATVEIEGQGNFTMSAVGSEKGKSYFVTLTDQTDGKLLPAISRGYLLKLTVPTPSGESKVLEIGLSGSGAAVSHVAKCR